MRIGRVLKPTVLEPPGGSDETEKLRTPVGLSRKPRLTPSTPLVDRTAPFPVFTTVAVPTIRPRASRNETCRTDSGNAAAALTRTPPPEAPAPTPALAVNAD